MQTWYLGLGHDWAWTEPYDWPFGPPDWLRDHLRDQPLYLLAPRAAPEAEGK